MDRPISISDLIMSKYPERLNLSVDDLLFISSPENAPQHQDSDLSQAIYALCKEIVFLRERIDAIEKING